MPRVGTCQDCEARFKVPDTTKATRAKCAKCGGVVNIPPLDGDAPAEKSPGAAGKAPASRAAPRKAAGKAPGRKAPARKAAGKAPAKAPARRAAPTKARAKAAPAGDGAEAEAPKTGRKAARKGATRKAGAKGRGRASGGKRKGKGGDDKQGKPMGLILGVLVLVLAGGGAGWWFTLGPGGEQAAPEPVVEVPETETPDEAAATEASEAAQAAAAIAAESVEKEPEEAPPPPPKPDEPLDPLLDFEPVGHALDSTPEDLESYTTLVTELFIDDATGRTRKRLLQELDELDMGVVAPAYINACIGQDMSRSAGVRRVFDLLRDFQERVANTPQFAFNGDITQMEVKDVNFRVKGIQGWVGWWNQTNKSQEALDSWRAKFRSRLAEDAGG